MTLTITLVAFVVEVAGFGIFKALGNEEVLSAWMKFFTIFWPVWIVVQLALIVAKGR